MAKNQVGPVTQLLIKARLRITPLKCHTRGALARGSNGLPLQPEDKGAVCWDASGSLEVDLHDKSFRAARSLLEKSAKELHQRSVSVVNDDRGHDAVLKMYNRAIVLAGGK